METDVKNDSIAIHSIAPASGMYITNSQYASLLKDEVISLPEDHASIVSSEVFHSPLIEYDLSVNQNLRVKNFNEVSNETSLLEPVINFKTTDDERLIFFLI